MKEYAFSYNYLETERENLIWFSFYCIYSNNGDLQEKLQKYADVSKFHIHK